MLILLKEKFDEKVIDSTLEIISKKRCQCTNTTHCLYRRLLFFDREEKLRSLYSKGNEKAQNKISDGDAYLSGNIWTYNERKYGEILQRKKEGKRVGQ